MISIQDVEMFLEKHEYDIRKSHNGRWIDQKCAVDVVMLVADCILEYHRKITNQGFTVSDIWGMDYAVKQVVTIFGKPDPSSMASNEYDKYFGQPIKMLENACVLRSEKHGNRYTYLVNEENVLEFLCFNENNCLGFICLYIEKVLRDSGIYSYFEDFFRLQTKDAFVDLKTAYSQFIISNTPINGTTECGRIFTKVLNPLAFKYSKSGTEKGRISQFPITKGQLLYNQQNWRDILANKPKDVERSFHLEKVALERSNVVEYEPGFTITLGKLESAGFGKVEIERFNETILSYGREHRFFTAVSFLKSCVETPADELGFDYYFYESLMKRIPSLYCLQYDEVFIFSNQTEMVNMNIIIESIVRENSKIGIDELISVLEDNFGIRIKRQAIMSRIKDTNIYYDDILGYLYKDYETYFQDV